jgi:hypothetical protein
MTQIESTYNITAGVFKERRGAEHLNVPAETGTGTAAIAVTARLVGLDDTTTG